MPGHSESVGLEITHSNKEKSKKSNLLWVCPAQWVRHLVYNLTFQTPLTSYGV